jgi:hypothetical protein
MLTIRITAKVRITRAKWRMFLPLTTEHVTGFRHTPVQRRCRSMLENDKDYVNMISLYYTGNYDKPAFIANEYIDDLQMIELSFSRNVMEIV